MDWTSVVALAVLPVAVAVGWFRGWSMLHMLLVGMTAIYVLSIVGTGAFTVSAAASPVLQELAWRPADLSLGAWTHWPLLLMTMFIHADAVHLLLNAVILAFMGLGLEERLGRGRFLTVFLVSGAVGTLLHTALNLAPLDRQVPVVGASGAVFGVIAAYATLFPRDKVVLFFLIIIPNVPVYIAAVAYTALELVALQATGVADNVARYGHLGGIVGGVLVGLAMMRWTRLEARAAVTPRRMDTAPLAALVSTDDQRRLLAQVEANRDEPEVAAAWLEKLARATPCPDCGEPLEATKGALRSACGFKVRVDRPAA